MSDSVLGHAVSTQNVRQCVGSRCEYAKRPKVCWVTLRLHKTSDSVLGHAVSTQNVRQCVESRCEYTKRPTVCWVM
jgi:hypothetical protein